MLPRLPEGPLTVIISFLLCDDDSRPFADIGVLQRVARAFRKRFLVMKEIKRKTLPSIFIVVYCRRPIIISPFYSRLVGSFRSLLPTLSHCRHTMESLPSREKAYAIVVLVIHGHPYYFGVKPPEYHQSVLSEQFGSTVSIQIAQSGDWFGWDSLPIKLGKVRFATWQ
jgi:hypothetical protein